MVRIDVRIDELFNEGIISIGEVGKLGRAGVKFVNSMNLSDVAEILGEGRKDAIDAITKIIEAKTTEESDDAKFAREFLESLQKEPFDVYTDDEGNIRGHRYQVSEQIGDALYHDVHVYFSRKEGFKYFGVLWFTLKGTKRQIKYEVTDSGRIIFDRYFSRTFFFPISALVRKVLGWFEDQVFGVEDSAIDDIDIAEVDQAISEIFN